MLFALVSQTRDVKPSDLYRMKPALEQNARHLCLAYLIDEPIGIEVIDRESELPKGCFPVVFVDGGQGGGILAEHWFDLRRDIPASRVLIDNTSGLNAGRHSACEAASHEILEAIVNPKVATWMPHPKRLGVETAYEVADPTQDTYTIRVGNTDWQVSNFVTTHWWRRDLVGQPAAVRAIEDGFGFGLDWCKRLREPGEIGPEGYAVMRERTESGRWRQWSEDMVGAIWQNSAKLAKPAKQHQASRTQRLLKGAA